MWSDWLEGIKLFLWTALVLVLGAVVGLIGSGVIDLGRPTSPSGPAGVSSPERGTETGRSLSVPETGRGTSPAPGDLGEPAGDFTEVARLVGPAVVSIEVRRRFEHPPLPEEGSPEFPEEGFDIPSSGSGFIFGSDGHVLTNDHVVSGARRVWVHLADGRTLDAEVVGTDPETDVAVLRVDPPEELPNLRLGKAADVEIGDWVAAVGNPLGYLDGTFTVGVVSAKGRSEVLIRGGAPSYQDFIQTDAAINFGNSGGPLVNRRGEVIGMNTAFGGEGSGIGFAIPIELASEVARSLIAEGRVTRAFLGVLLQEVDLDLARGLGLPSASGVLIREVYPDTPASRAGLRLGDAVLEVDGVPVRDVASFRLQIAHSPIGRAVRLTGQRWGTPLAVDVILGPRDGEEPNPPQAPVVHPEGMGLAVEALPDSMRNAGSTGVRIRAVDADSWAADAGVEVGDRVVEVDGHKVKGEREFREFADRAMSERRPLVLLLDRGGVQWFAAVPTVRPGGSR